MKQWTSFISCFLAALCDLHRTGSWPYLKHLQTFQGCLGLPHANHEVCDLVQSRARLPSVSDIQKLVVEVDNNTRSKEFQGLLDQLELIVPEVTVFNVKDDECWWLILPLLH